MAAVITLGSVAVGTTGKIVTATISGGTGTGYAISMATGIYPSVTSGKKPVFPLASATVSGTTLTLTLPTPIGSGETAQLAILAAAPLTDSGGNTPTGQTLLAVTNNSTVTVTTIDASQSGVALEINGNQVTGSIVSEFATTNVDNFNVEFVTDASEVASLTFSQYPASVAVDGGAVAVASPAIDSLGGSQYAVAPLTSSPLAGGKHLFLLAQIKYFVGLRLIGGTRSLYTVPTTKKYLIPGAATVNFTAATPVAVAGAYAPITSSGWLQPACNHGGAYAGFSIDVGFTGTGVEVASVTQAATSWSVEVDSVPPGALTAGGDVAVTNQANYVPLVVNAAEGVAHTLHAMLVGLGGGMVSRYVRVLNGAVVTTASTVGATTVVVNSVTNIKVNDWVRIDKFGTREWRQVTGITGTTLTLNAALAKAHAVGVQVTSYEAPAGSFTTYQKYTFTNRIVAMGDSNTAGANDYGGGAIPDSNGTYYSFFDPRCTPAYLAAIPLGLEVVNLGIQGQITRQMLTRDADITSYSRGSAKYVMIWPGTNDINGTGVTSDLTDYTNDVQAMITVAQGILAAGGSIILMPPLTPVGTTNSHGLSNANTLTALQSLASSNANTVCVSNLAVGLVPGDYNGVHYHLAGQSKMAATLAPYLGGAVGSPVLAAAGFFAT